jgi:hypothetical protein
MLRFCRGNDLVESTGRASNSDFQYSWRNYVNGTGWALEAAVPWTAALATGSLPGNIEDFLPVIGFDIIVNDLDEENLIPRDEHSQLVFDRDESEIPGILMEDEALRNTRTFGIAILENALATNSLHSLSDIKLYPNPARNQLFLSGLDKVEIIEIVNISGQKVMQLIHPEIDISVDISKLPSGPYLIRFFTHGGQNITKLLSVE